MKRTKWNKIISVFSLSFVFQFICVDGFAGQYPKELKKLALANGLKPLYDYSGIEPEVEGPTYVYGDLSDYLKDVCVFWAWKEAEGEKVYYIIIKLRAEDADLCDCPVIIKWWNAPMELSFYENEKVKLSWFTSLEDRKKKIPKSYKAEKNFIRIGNDTLDALFYCYKKAWWVLQRC